MLEKTVAFIQAQEIQQGAHIWVHRSMKALDDIEAVEAQNFVAHHPSIALHVQYSS